MRKDAFRDFVLAQLNDLRGLSFGPMFGGDALRCGAAFFGIVHNGRLYFRVNDVTRPAFEAARSGPFRIRSGRIMREYLEVPHRVLEDAALAVEWAEQAIAATQETGKARRRKIRHR